MNCVPWDHHGSPGQYKTEEGARKLIPPLDKALAALFTDLRQRGLYDKTLVVAMGEFGRTPVAQGKDGRDHNRHAFSLWVAGGGFRGGHVHGATDDFGYKSVQDVVPVHDFWVGMIKAPVFGLIIAIAGCYNGMQVEANSEEVGLRTTMAVVAAIFAVIVLDAFFAVFFTEVGWG